MPAKFKFLISAIVAVVAIAAYYFQAEAGHPLTPWVALGLGGFMIFAIWLFPETRKDK